MAYTTIDKPSDHFNTVLYTGNNSSQAITGVGFQPDWIWLKSRTGTYGAYNPQAYDSVRGFTTGGDLTPANTNVEGVDSGAHGYISAVGADGFTLTGGSTNSHQNNGASTTYVAWNWKAGTSFSNDASATSVGSIDSTGSVSTTAGFSIISYTGNNTGGATVAHGLGATPGLIIIKNRDDDSSAHWAVWHHKAYASAGDPNIVYLQNTAAAADDTNIRHSSVTTSSTVFSIGDYNGVNGNGDKIISYCFSEVKGYSKFGKYSGNDNTEGPFVFTGFKPAWLMIKRAGTEDTSSNMNGSHWVMLDNKRDTLNNTGAAKALTANRNNAEDTTNLTNVNFLSNGFKFRGGADAVNDSGTYIFMAFAESPFVNSKGVPNNAR